MIGRRDPPPRQAFHPGEAVVCVDSGKLTGLVKGGVYHVARPDPDALPTVLLRLTEFPGLLFHPIRFTRAKEP